MRRSGSADLPLHYGSVPPWLLERMSRLSLAMTEIIIADYGQKGFLSRLSNPFWFQSFGAVTGMDWHSSGITTSIMGVLKRMLNPRSKELGIYVCGGKGQVSRNTPVELIRIADLTGLDATSLVRTSKLCARVDNNAVQDGYQIYLHNFILSAQGDWTVIQQGMNESAATARRYHWHSANVNSFVEDPHSGIAGINVGQILNLADKKAAVTRDAIPGLTKENPQELLKEIDRLLLPAHHDVRLEDVNMKRLGAALWLAKDKQPRGFEELLLLDGTGPRTIQSLALVSEVMHGTPSRFNDPARFSFAHGGKDGHPFPVPTKTYDETLQVLESAVQRAKIGITDKNDAIKRLHAIALDSEKNFTPAAGSFGKIIDAENANSWRYGGRTVMGKAVRPGRKVSTQLRLF